MISMGFITIALANSVEGSYSLNFKKASNVAQKHILLTSILLRIKFDRVVCIFNSILGSP